MRICALSFSRVLMKSDGNVGWEYQARDLRSGAAQMVPQVEVRALGGPVKFFHNKLKAYLTKPGASIFPKCYNLVRRFTRDEWPRTNPDEQPHNFIPSQLNFTVGTVQPGKQSSSGLHQSQTRPSDCQKEKRDLSFLRTVTMRFIPLHLMVGIGLWLKGLHAAAQSKKPIP